MSFERESFKVKFSDSESFKVKIKEKQNNAINVTELDSGVPGPKGEDGFSPLVDVTVEDNTPIVTVTDIRGTTVTEFPKIHEYVAGNGIFIDDDTISVTDLILDCGSASRVTFNG